MAEEEHNNRKKYAGEKKASMKRRDDHHDYTERRMYMITLEVEGRRPVFGRLVGDAFAPAGSADEPHIELTALGKAVQSEWLGIHGHYPQIDVMAVQMMPDHLHGILFVKAQLPVHLGQVISGFKAGCRKAEKALTAAGQATAAEPLSTEKAGQTGEAAGPAAVPAAAQTAAGAQLSPQAAALPSQSAPYRPLFAKGYNDLILRSYDELPTWQNYLRDNPRRLLMKRTSPEWLRPFFGLRIGSHTYSGIGNRALLTAPKLKSVRVSRRLNDQEVEAEVNRCLAEARMGTVLVSPAISPGEKRVMRAAFDAKLATINAEQCRQMNLMAIEICEQNKHL